MTSEDFGKLGSKIKYLNDKQAAYLLGLGEQTLRNWRMQSKGPVYVKAGRAVRYNFKDLISFMERGRVDPEN